MAEEISVYPLTRAHVPDGNAKVEHDTAKHKELERAMKALEGLRGDDPQFTAALDRLEIPWRPMGRWDISIARREGVERLDELVGPKA